MTYIFLLRSYDFTLILTFVQKGGGDPGILLRSVGFYIVFVKLSIVIIINFMRIFSISLLFVVQV